MLNKNNVLRIVAGLILLAGSVHAAAQAQLYFIYTDQLNTPRLIANTTGQTVWTWTNDDPFGNNAPNENPSNLGNFTCNLRLLGQYFDKETNLHYNYLRDYDPAIGRYVESDPIGLRGGLNLYAYVNSNPLSYSDQFGLVRTLPGPGGIPIPVPTPLPSPGGKKPGSANDDIFDPPMPKTPSGTSTTQQVPQLPPLRPQGPRPGCKAMFEACMKGADKCWPGIQQGVWGICLAAFITCQSLGLGDGPDLPPGAP